MSEVPSFNVLLAKALPSPAHREVLAYGPRMELLAVGTQDNHVFIFRLNGQRVYGALQKTRTATLEPQRLAWKPNGQLLASAWSDGSVRLLDPESSKVAHQIFVLNDPSDADIKITCLTWVTNSTRTAAINKKDDEGTQGVWKQILAEEHQWTESKKDKSTLGLPRELALLDIEPSLPKISTLTSGSTADDVFGTRASVDALFRPFHPKANEAVDVLIVGTSDGRLHLSIYDSFVLGSFPPPMKSSRAAGNVLVAHASHTSQSLHALLMKSSSTLVRGLTFVPMDLRFITSGKDYLSLLASRSTTLQNLLRYVNQVQSVMATEFHAGRDLPGKFVRNANDAFNEAGSGWGIVPALYSQVLTGHMLPEVKEWLNDVGERGYKRWDKAVTNSLNALRTLIHKKFIPTLTRIALIGSRLQGLALYYTPTSQSPCVLGFSASQISLLLDTTASLTLLAEHMLTAVVDEIDIYTTFSEWFRNELIHVVTDKTPTMEELEKESNINHSKVLQYIQNSLMDSKLKPFFGDVAEDEVKAEFDKIGTANPIFGPLTLSLRELEARQSCSSVLLNVEVLVQHLVDQATSVFKQIAEAEKRNVLFGSTIDIVEGMKDGPIAMRMVGDAEDPRKSTTYVAQIGKDGTSTQFTRLVFDTEKGVSSHVTADWASVAFCGKVIDIAYWNDDYVLVLYSGRDGEVMLGRFSYRIEGDILNYHYLKIQDARPVSMNDIPDSNVRIDLGAESSDFMPEKLFVTESEKLVVLSQGGRKYKVFEIRTDVRDIDSMVS